ncbi:hypothetical protein PO878_03890 [Iamia majanohamensis]|uniref:Uncharacterized protein n=1 Tax=Iamia majanohamensis TaxID=467976 RepID=A0AAE9Y6Z4_9ACTN|nr:hypothetical protein [Iamia majanohamensis]WCO67864.1 hypothetical protein PO878_03890 [Iamia majanohamensis]
MGPTVGRDMRERRPKTKKPSPAESQGGATDYGSVAFSGADLSAGTVYESVDIPEGVWMLRAVHEQAGATDYEIGVAIYASLFTLASDAKINYSPVKANDLIPGPTTANIEGQLTINAGTVTARSITWSLVRAS